MERYAIDPAASAFAVKAFAAGMFSAFGHSPTLAIREFHGEAEFAPGTLEQAAVRITIKAGALTVTDKVSDKDRREIERATSQDVLETAKYPDIVFESSKVSATKAGDGQYRVNVVGNLSLHGITKSQPVEAQVAFAGNTLRAHGEFSVLQSAYGIKPISIGGGALKLKDELKLSFDIVARKDSTCV